MYFKKDCEEQEKGKEKCRRQKIENYRERPELTKPRTLMQDQDYQWENRSENSPYDCRSISSKL